MDLSGYNDEDLFERVLRPNLEPGYDWAEILEDPNVDRVRAVLTLHLRRVQNELSLRASGMDAAVSEANRNGRHQEAGRIQADFHKWRSRTVKFVQLLELRLGQVKQAHRALQQRQMAAEKQVDRRAERDALRRLAVAVAAHQNACAAEDMEPSPVDMKLWETLDEITVPFGAGRATLSQLIDTVWYDEQE